ncbi:MAG TPA: hypothetical protein VG817_07295 [Gemmatimonadales bacterium]|nr:hypothetical protein [Gemmatimonadales bacterium]
MQRSLIPARVLLCAAALAVAACGDDDKDSNGPGDRNLSDFITSVSTNYEAPVVAPPAVYHPGRPPKTPRVRFPALSLRDPVNAVFHEGAPPSTSGADAATTSENSSALQGQPYRLAVTAAGAFSTVYVWVEGVDGYYELTIPAPVTTSELVIGLANDPPQGTFNITTAVGSGGTVSASASTEVEPRDLGDADFAATVTWTGASDVDIHVLDPNGFEVYYGATESPEGGLLDLDSNADCAIDNINTETISWPAGTAPSGDYKVVIEYYDDCGVESSTYSVLVRRKGRANVSVDNHTFTGDYTANAPDTVGTYTYP